jgi:hypothetical protein
MTEFMWGLRGTHKGGEPHVDLSLPIREALNTPLCLFRSKSRKSSISDACIRGFISRWSQKA